MKIKIFQKRKNYREDMLRFYISSVFGLEFKIILVVYFFIFVVFLLNTSKFIVFYPFLFKALTVSLGIGILGMFIYGVILIFKKKKNINRESKNIYQGEVEINLTNDLIVVKAKGYINGYKLKWSNLKKVKIIKNTMHIIPKASSGEGVSINKREIIEGDFDEVCRFVKEKL